MKVRCFFGFHDWVVLEEVDGYHTVSTWDEIGDCGTVYHGVFLERCACCGKHRTTATGQGHRAHSGIARLRKRWKAMEKDDAFIESV